MEEGVTRGSGCAPAPNPLRVPPVPCRIPHAGATTKNVIGGGKGGSLYLFSPNISIQFSGHTQGNLQNY